MGEGHHTQREADGIKKEKEIACTQGKACSLFPAEVNSCALSWIGTSETVSKINPSSLKLLLSGSD